MRGHHPRMLCILILACTCLSGIVLAEDQVMADIVLTNGTIYTVEPLTAWEKTPMEAIAISRDTILAVNDSEVISRYIGPETTVTDLEGRMVLPGFIDTHIHLGAAAQLRAGIDLSSCRSIEEIQKQLLAYAADHPEKDIIRGSGWNYYLFNESGPDFAMIDVVIPDKIVILTSFDGHATWVNTAALKAAGIDASTPDPTGGQIIRAKDGSPTGILREMAAANLVNEAVPPISPDEIVQTLTSILPNISATGITTVDDAAVTPEMIAAYASLEEDDALPVRVNGEMVAVPEIGAAEIPVMELGRTVFSSGSQSRTSSRWLDDDLPYALQESVLFNKTNPFFMDGPERNGLFRLQTGKLFLDGVIEGHTGYLLEPYADQPDNNGMITWNRSEFNQMITDLDAEEFQGDIHAIGDGAVRMSLDAYEEARIQNGIRDSRHKISHIQLINRKDISRFAEYGVIAALQPNWFYYDINFQNVSLPYLGPERAGQMYTLLSLLDEGVIVAFGSDWPVGTDYLTYNPLDGIRTAVTRLPLPPDAPVSSPYRPEEKIDLKTAIEAATYAGAYTNFMENTTGSLQPGKIADIIVLDRDLFMVQPEEINTARVVATFLEGRPVYVNQSELTLNSS